VTKRPPRERVLRAASKLFYLEGIRSVGVDRIAREADVSKMTLYRHFPTKDDLVVATLERREGPAREAFEQAALAASDDPREQLLAIFELLAPWFGSDGFRGCPFMNATLELADAEHPARRVAGEHKERTRAFFERLAREAGARDPEALSHQLLLLFDGAIAETQIAADPRPGRDAAAAARALVLAALRKRPARPAAQRRATGARAP
jgi:AcrR family transcriptional regulator